MFNWLKNLKKLSFPSSSCLVPCCFTHLWIFIIKDLVPDKYTFEMHTNVRMFLSYIVENVIEKNRKLCMEGGPREQKVIVGESDTSFVYIQKVALLALRPGPNPYLLSVHVYISKSKWDFKELLVEFYCHARWAQMQCNITQQNKARFVSTWMSGFTWLCTVLMNIYRFPWKMFRITFLFPYLHEQIIWLYPWKKSSLIFLPFIENKVLKLTGLLWGLSQHTKSTKYLEHTNPFYFYVFSECHMDTDYNSHDSDSRQESGLSVVDSPSSLLTELWIFNLWWSKRGIKESKIDLIYSEKEIYLCIGLCPVCLWTNVYVYVASWRTPLGVRQFIVQLHLCKIYEVEVQRRQWQPTSVLLPGKSHGRRSLVGCSPWSH